MGEITIRQRHARKPSARSDVTIASLTVLDSPNQPVTASVSLKNQGTAAGGGRLFLSAGTRRLSEILVKPVPAGGNVTLTLKLPLPYDTDTDRLTAELNPRFRQSQRQAQAALFERDIRQPLDLRM